jgi:hypothetical protein
MQLSPAEYTLLLPLVEQVPVPASLKSRPASPLVNTKGPLIVPPLSNVNVNVLFGLELPTEMLKKSTPPG